jgi:type II secretory pathway pseudopilin PulG
MWKTNAFKKPLKSEAGITMIEMLMAGAILTIGSLGMIGLIVGSIATNNRNKLDSTQTMLAGSVLEQINSTVIGQGSSQLTDCAGNDWTIDTFPGGAALSGSSIDFTQATPPTNYHMDYVVNTPCDDTGAPQGTYDVRWRVDIIGTTNTYLLTVGAKLKNTADQGSLLFSAPVTLRVLSGN